MYDIDLALKDELPQTFTTQDIEDIKSAIDVPRANVTILNTVYSPEETKIGVWREYRTVDNEQVLMEKPVYEKTINFGALPNTTTKSVSLGIENLDSVVSISGVAKNGGYYRFLPIIDMDNSTWNVAYYIDLGELKIQTKQNYSSYSAYITIRYTKTSDSWQEVSQ